MENRIHERRRTFGRIRIRDACHCNSAPNGEFKEVRVIIFCFPKGETPLCFERPSGVS